MFAHSSITPHNRQTNKKLVKIIHTLLETEQSAPFRKPVPHKALGLGDYKNIVKKPIDLNQIRRQNNEGRYKIIEEAFDDIQLCWDNCKVYNHPSSEIYQQALILQEKFKNMVVDIFPNIHEKVQNNDSFNKLQIKNLSAKKMSMEDEHSYNQPESRLDSGRKMEKVENQNSQFEIEKRKEELQIEEEVEESPNNDNKSQKSDLREPAKEPIMVNLYERPSTLNIQQLNRKMKQIEENKQLVEEVLEILYTFERENMSTDKNGQISFKINQIHLSTYYRICKVLKLEPEEQLQIIE